MMIMTPQEDLEKLTYKELLERKNEIISFITEFGTDFNMDKLEWNMNPKPDVQYQVCLEELGRIAYLLSAAFNEEYESSEKKMKNYYEDMKRIKERTGLAYRVKKLTKCQNVCYNIV